MLEKYVSMPHVQPCPALLAQHGGPEHVTRSLLEPWQDAPPPLGDGLLHERVRGRVPVPQLALHPPLNCQLPQRPLTLGKRFCPPAHRPCTVAHCPLHWIVPYV